MNGKKWVWLAVAVVLAGAGMALAWKAEWRYGYMPSAAKTVNMPAREDVAAEAEREGVPVGGAGGNIGIAEDGTVARSAGEQGGTTGGGAYDAFRLGRETLYKETFGNEVFLSDIMGALDGPLTIGNIAKAVVKLGGRGTTNLRVELAEDFSAGSLSLKKGDMIDTGLDVPRGAFAPLGMPIAYAEGKLKVGITCMACHATVDRDSGKVIEGAPNADLNAGLLMALATNSAAYFTHTDIENLQSYMKDLKRQVPTSDGGSSPLPDPEALEKAVDANLVKWPRGNFDSSIDMKSNPTQIPDMFTKAAHPYGWSGFAAVGPFHGLSAFSNNVHAQNSDPLAQAEASRALFDLDKEVYLGTLLQRASNRKYRYDPASGVRPSEFFAAVDPTPGVPGVNEMIRPPSFPKLTMMAPDGLYISSPGFRAGEQVNAAAAYQNALAPPFRTGSAKAWESGAKGGEAKKRTNHTVLDLGREVFVKAKCIDCHAGAAFTNHRIIPSPEIGTEPSRAQALKKTGRMFGDSYMYAWDTPVPVPPGARVVKVPTDHLDPEQVKLGFAHGDSPGGYKVKGLIGLAWSAPYLHDGGVAAGPKPDQLGLAGTVMKGVAPDPENSLRALIDRELRGKVIEANRSAGTLAAVHVTGEGHAYWVDAGAGYTKEQQNALIRYLLSLKYSD